MGCVGRGLEKRWWVYKVRIKLIRIMFTGLAGFIFDVLAHFHGSCSVDFWCTCCLPICSATISGVVVQLSGYNSKTSVGSDRQSGNVDKLLSIESDHHMDRTCSGYPF